MELLLPRLGVRVLHRAFCMSASFPYKGDFASVAYTSFTYTIKGGIEMKKRNMLVGISAVALTFATTGCAPQDTSGTSNFSTNQVVSTEAQEDAMEQQSGFDDCEKMELVQGDAYSGGEDEVWYCNDENSTQQGSFFMPFMAGYFTSSVLNSKHGINVSNYKPGTSKSIISKTTYNKSAKKPLPSSKKNQSSAVPVGGGNKANAKSGSKTSSTSKSGSFGSGSKSSGFGSFGSTSSGG